jgi:hypothetical protein
MDLVPIHGNPELDWCKRTKSHVFFFLCEKQINSCETPHDSSEFLAFQFSKGA